MTSYFSFSSLMTVRGSSSPLHLGLGYGLEIYHLEPVSASYLEVLLEQKTIVSPPAHLLHSHDCTEASWYVIKEPTA